jgi:hypothetical protein
MTTKTIDLQHLRQCELAYILGWTTERIRKRSDLFQRDGQGLYDARQAVAAVLEEARRASGVLLLEPCAEDFEKLLGAAEAQRKERAAAKRATRRKARKAKKS